MSALFDEALDEFAILPMDEALFTWSFELILEEDLSDSSKRRDTSRDLFVLFPPDRTSSVLTPPKCRKTREGNEGGNRIAVAFGCTAVIAYGIAVAFGSP